MHYPVSPSSWHISSKKATDTISKLEKFWLKEKDTVVEDGVSTLPTSDPASIDTVKVQEAKSNCQSTLTSKIEEVKTEYLPGKDLQELKVNYRGGELAQPRGGRPAAIAGYHRESPTSTACCAAKTG